MRSERLREAREALDYSQNDLAEMVGTSQRQIWRWENGSSDPGGEMVAKLALSLNISSDYLLGISDDPTPVGLMPNRLTAKERAVVAAMRREEPLEAVRLIVEIR